jgi:hypothetical protein
MAGVDRSQNLKPEPSFEMASFRVVVGVSRLVVVVFGMYEQRLSLKSRSASRHRFRVRV